jgi:hypothetical protein
MEKEHYPYLSPQPSYTLQSSTYFQLAHLPPGFGGLHPQMLTIATRTAIAVTYLVNLAEQPILSFSDIMPNRSYWLA